MQYRRYCAKTHILLSIDDEAHPRTLEYLNQRSPPEHPPLRQRPDHSHMELRLLKRPCQFKWYLTYNDELTDQNGNDDEVQVMNTNYLNIYTRLTFTWIHRHRAMEN